jgi:hypothetical protein
VQVSTVEKVSRYRGSREHQSKLSDQPTRVTGAATRPEKINGTPWMSAEVWNCKSSDHIKGYDGNVSTLIDFLIEGQSVRTRPASWPFQIKGFFSSLTFFPKLIDNC